MSYAIRATNLSKHYRINHARQSVRYRTLRDTIAEVVTAPWRHLKNGATLFLQPNWRVNNNRQTPQTLNP